MSTSAYKTSKRSIRRSRRLARAEAKSKFAQLS